MAQTALNFFNFVWNKFEFLRWRSQSVVYDPEENWTFFWRKWKTITWTHNKHSHPPLPLSTQNAYPLSSTINLLYFLIKSLEKLIFKRWKSALGKLIFLVSASKMWMRNYSSQHWGEFMLHVTQLWCCLKQNFETWNIFQCKVDIIYWYKMTSFYESSLHLTPKTLDRRTKINYKFGFPLVPLHDNQRLLLDLRIYFHNIFGNYLPSSKMT